MKNANVKTEFSSEWYKYIHGKRPSGYGTWFFEFNNDHNIDNAFKFVGKYSTAKKAALKAAKEQFASSVSVCS